jgi:hypothetical protein
MTRFIQQRFEILGEELGSQLVGKSPVNVVEVAASILPTDDSSLQWSPAGSGLSDDLHKTLEQLYERFVERYEQRPSQGRGEEDVWRTYKRHLEVFHVLSRLRPKQIGTTDYDRKFDYAWQNRIWHVCEPVSFDLQEPANLLEKANGWVGRMTILHKSSERFKLHLLLGEPTDHRLFDAFEKSINILKSMPGNNEVVRENEAEKFAKSVAEDLKDH